MRRPVAIVLALALAAVIPVASVRADDPECFCDAWDDMGVCTHASCEDETTVTSPSDSPDFINGAVPNWYDPTRYHPHHHYTHCELYPNDPACGASAQPNPKPPDKIPLQVIVIGGGVATGGTTGTNQTGTTTTPSPRTSPALYTQPPSPGPDLDSQAIINTATCWLFAGYLDVNFSATIPTQVPLLGLGPTFGVQMSKGGVNPYGGLAAGTPGVAVTVTRSGSSPSPGLNVAGGGSIWPGISPAVQGGYGAVARSGSAFGEGGAAFGTPGAQGQAVWVLRTIPAEIGQCR